jgi:hypothetical protein
MPLLTSLVAMRSVTRFIPVLIACAGLLVVSGCFEVGQSLVIEGNRAQYRAEIRVDARLAALAQRNADSAKGFCEEIKLPAEAKSRGVEAETTQQTLQGEVVCTVRLRGPIEAFFAALDRQSSAGVGKFSIERIDASTLRIENVLEPQAGAAGAASGRSFENTMTESLFAGRTLRWSVTAPRILESNGVISADGRSVDWSVPVGAAMKVPQRFYATVRVELGLMERIRLWFIDQWRAIRRVLRELLSE